MSRYYVPMIQCDGSDGWCGLQAADFYEQGASSADGVRITSTQRHPGWISTEDEDFCPECRKDQA